MTLTLSSTAFSNHGAIPRKHTGEGEDVSPPLSWSGLPPEAKDLALVCADPDAPTDKPFVHWVLYNIPPSTSELPEGISSEAKLAEPLHALQGRNSAGGVGYMGPMPPVGHGQHHYVFRLYALKSPVKVLPASSLETLNHEIEENILATAELVGLYERQSARKAA